MNIEYKQIEIDSDRILSFNTRELEDHLKKAFTARTIIRWAVIKVENRKALIDVTFLNDDYE